MKNCDNVLSFFAQNIDCWYSEAVLTSTEQTIIILYNLFKSFKKFQLKIDVFTAVKNCSISQACFRYDIMKAFIGFRVGFQLK